MRSLYILQFLVSVVLVKTDPIFIRSGVASNKDAGKSEDANVYGLNSAKGVQSYDGADGFHKEDEGKHVHAQDSGKYGQEDAQKNAHSNEDNFADNKFHQAQGGEVADYNKKSQSKKGHHKSGYNKSYKKDESENTSSFYDDSDNEEGGFVHNNKKNLYGDAGAQNQRGSNLDDRRYAHEQGKQGAYNNAGNYDRDLQNQKGYHTRNYYDANENEGRRNAANRYGDYGRYEDEKYLKKNPHYYHEPDHYYSSPRKITIYEDPRYDVPENYPPPYNSDYIQLEVKRPPRDYDPRDYDTRDYAPRDYDYYRHQERKPYYDYYYY